MTPSQASRIIGVTQQHVRWLIRAGKLPATRTHTTTNQFGWEYAITLEDAEQFRDARNARLARVRVGQGNYKR